MYQSRSSVSHPEMPFQSATDFYSKAHVFTKSFLTLEFVGRVEAVAKPDFFSAMSGFFPQPDLQYVMTICQIEMV